MLIVRLKTCPEPRSARRKRSQSLLSLEHVTVCGAVDQLFAMGEVEAERVRGVAGRPAGRLVRTPTRGYSPPLGAPEAGTPGRLTLTLPVCVVEDDGRDLQTLQ